MVFIFLLDLILLNLFGMDSCNTYDMITLQDDRLNYTNILGAARFEGMGTEEIKKWVIEKS